MTVNLFKLFFFLFISFLLLTPIALVITNGLSAIFLTNELYINRYLIGSTKLIVLVSIFTTIISVPLAWINTMTEFWGRKFLQIFAKINFRKLFADNSKYCNLLVTRIKIFAISRNSDKIHEYLDDKKIVLPPCNLTKTKF